MLGFFVKGEKQKIINLCNEHNGKYHSSVKGWHYVKVPANELNEFSLSKYLENLHISLYPGTTHNDTMRVNNKINDIHSGAGALQSSYSGKDVVMGFIDTGLDWSHGDFKNADGSTRIIALWDHTLSNSSNTPVGYGYGQEWDSIGINQGLATAHTDYSGHGTTVTGTGAGNGLANGTHKGVANESDIIAVEIDFNSANFLGSIVDATEYIYNIADSMSKPCVINGSLGTYFGSHDGLDPYSLYIDSLINDKKGRLFVCSAGNSGNWGAYHLHADVNNDTTFTWFKPHSNYNYLFIELWADTGAFNQLEYCLGADMHTPNYSFRGNSQYLNILNHLNTVTYDTIKNSNNDAIALLQKEVNKVQKEIDGLQGQTGDVSKAKTELRSLRKNKDTSTEKKLEYVEERTYNEVIGEMLKDTGIKTKVIKQYLPVMNRLINQYLQILDFFVSFHLDENFNETIRSRHRDSFNYASFSEGEKQRIDLALLFTWRQIAKMKNSAASNLLILDETFDSSLDVDGVDNLTKILDTLDDGSNVFIISHKGDVLENKFRSKIEFFKERNFSKIK